MPAAAAVVVAAAPPTKGDDDWDDSWGADGADEAAGRGEAWGRTTWAGGATAAVGGRRSKDRAD